MAKCNGRFCNNATTDICDDCKEDFCSECLKEYQNPETKATEALCNQCSSKYRW